MIKKLNEDTALKFKSISPEEKEKKGILGRLYGNVASFAAPTRNGRKYDQSLWEQLFESDLIKERFANGGIFGQLCHPEYEEVDMEKIACVMPEPPVKDDKGNLVAYVDLVDTPCGRIAYQLAKYGYKFGISSRGTGDITYNDKGEEIVDPDTYQLNAFDLVEIPAVESARLAFVESLDTKKKHGKTLKQKLTEEINKASDEDKKIMKETLGNLNIDINEDLVDVTETELSKIENALKAIGFTIVKKGKTLFDNVHYQLEMNGDFNGHTFLKVVDDLKHLVEFYDKDLHAPITFNVGYSNEFDKITCGLDVHKKFIKEELKDEDGWGETIPDELENTFEELEALMYEIRNARRGAYAGFGDRVSDLVDELNRLSDKLSTDADTIEINQDELNETVEDCSDKKEVEANAEVVNDKDELVKELQEALAKSAKLEKDNLSLQEQLSVCLAKESKLEEDLSKNKKALINLSNSSKKINILKEKLDDASILLDKKTKLLESTTNKLAQNKERVNNLLNESTKANDLNLKVTKLTNTITKLNEELSQKDKAIADNKKLIEKYKVTLNRTKDSYIRAQAVAFGISEQDIRSKLKESYSIKDIDSICEELSAQKLNMSKLPFRLNENTRFNIKTSKNEYIRGNSILDDDIISENLLRMLDE